MTLDELLGICNRLGAGQYFQKDRQANRDHEIKLPMVYEAHRVLWE